jgi:hypothetical protein
MQTQSPRIVPPPPKDRLWPAVVTVFVVVALFQAMLGDQLWGSSRGGVLPAEPDLVTIADSLTPADRAMVRVEVAKLSPGELCRICQTNEQLGYGLGLDAFRSGYGWAPGRPPVVAVYDAIMARCPCS